MLTSYIKKCRARPPLTVIEPGKIPELKPSSAIEKLATLNPGELELQFDDDYSGNDITDPFEDDRKIPDTIKKVKKKWTRYEQNIELIRCFSSKFKEAMDETRKDLQIAASYHYVDMDQIDKVIEAANQSKDVPKAIEEKLNSMYNNEKYIACGSDLGIPDRDPNAVEADKEFDIMSGVWKMLKSTDNDIIASPPGYNAYQQQNPHWLDRGDIKEETMDSARSKCEHWLEKQN